MTVWRFGEFELDTQRYELRGNGAVIRVEPQVFDVMTHLVSNHERMVTKEELFDAVKEIIAGMMTPDAPMDLSGKPAASYAMGGWTHFTR